MEIDDLDCPLCKGLYNLNNKLPILLSICGHTFCQECVKKLYYPDSFTLICPEDNLKMENIQNLEILPKNVTLLNLMQKIQKRKLNSSMSLYIENKSTLLDNQIQLTHRHTVSVIPSISTNIFENQITQKNIIESYKNICLQHRRPLEIVCLDHQIKICTSCALFGDHKNHNLRSEDDIIKETSIKAEILIQYYEIIEKNIEKYERENSGDILEDLKKNFFVKNNLIKENIKNYFSELRFILETKENQLIGQVEGVENKFEKDYIKKFEVYENCKKDVYERVLSWRQQ
jgi:hypothetical protein